MNNNNTRDPQYSWVFQELTKNDEEQHDLLNYIAYCLYKQRKIDFLKSKNGNPNPTEIENFNTIYTLPAQLAGLRNEAEKILTDILNGMYSEKILEVETRLQGEFAANLTSKVENLISTNQQNHSSLHQEFQGFKNSIDVSMKELKDRGYKYWCGEITRGVIITVLAVLLVWGLSFAILGKSSLSNFENKYISDSPISNPKEGNPPIINGPNQ